MRSDLLRVVICGTALALAGQAVAEGQLTKVETRTFADGLKLQIVGKRLPKPKVFTGNAGKTTFEFRAYLPGTGEKVHVGEHGLQSFAYYWYKSSPHQVRVQFVPETKGTKPTLTKNSEGWLISWTKATPILQLGQVAKPTLGEVAKPTIKIAVKQSPVVDSLFNDTKAKKVQAQSETKPIVKPVATKIKATVSDSPSWHTTTTKNLNERIFAEKTVVKAESPKIRKVSLQFVNTDVVQILRALAMQSRVNIVTSPEVRGMLTVALEDVTVTQSLDLVTTMTGLAWESVNNTYIVAPKSKIISMVNDLRRNAPMAVESRVVPIYSGEGTQIKAALIRTLRPETESGTFEIALPSEETKVEKKTEDKNGAEQNGKEADNTKETKIETKAVTTQKDLYVVVMGSPQRVSEVTEIVRKLDLQFCETLGIVPPTSAALVRKTYQVRGGSAQDLAKAIAGEARKVGNVEISATPAASSSNQSVVLYGRENEVNSVLQTLAQLDSSEQVGDDYVMYDVQFSDPRALREAIVSQVPGLRASIPPASAGNPRLYTPGLVKAEANDMVNSDPNKKGSPVIGLQANDPKVTGENGNVDAGLAQPFNGVEPAAVPMKLLLRGTDEQLNAARAYLRLVDVAPKQIALELRVMELTKEDALRIGIDWNIFTGGAVSLLRFNQSLATAGSNSATARVSGDRFGADITATLDSIADKNRLIARPNLFAIDGRESEIFVGDIVRYVSSRSTNPTTGEINLVISEIPVGVRLAVLPRIGSNGSITMDLRPVVSSITGFLNAGPGIQIPQTSSRIAQSTLNMQSGETIAIGGLIQDEDVRNTSKVPILGDLPLIGVLFRRTDNSKIRREVVFFLTAREVSAANRRNAADPRESESRNGTEMGPLKNGKGG